MREKKRSRSDAANIGAAEGETRLCTVRLITLIYCITKMREIQDSLHNPLPCYAPACAVLSLANPWQSMRCASGSADTCKSKKKEEERIYE